jgi:hypothetical protein
MASVLAFLVWWSCLGMAEPLTAYGAGQAAVVVMQEGLAADADGLDESVANEPCAPTGVECPADSSGPPQAGPAVVAPVLMMAPPRASAMAALHSRGPDTPQRPPCRA